MAAMQAEIISIGTELLLGQIIDTDAAFLSQRLAEVGVSVYRRVTVGDNLQRVVAALKESLSRVDVVITIGGLGPTEDDLTREGISESLGENLILDEQIAAHLRELFTSRNIKMTESQFRQAMRPQNARPLPNPHGTAPGLIVEKPPKTVIALPGPRNEFEPMVIDQVIPYLAQKTGGALIRSRVLRLCGVGEAFVEERVRDLIRSENPTVAPLAQVGEVHLRITARAGNVQEAERLLDEKEAALRQRLGKVVYGVDEETLEQVVVHLLIERRQTVAVAESCTGGLLGNRITNVSGSSEVFLGGVIAYSNALKMSLLGVPEEVLNTAGAVSEETARAMAEGVRRLTDAHWGISITGIAGPTGGTPTKPVGSVYIGLSDPKGTIIEYNQFIGHRKAIKRRASQAALVLLRKQLIVGGSGNQT